MGLLDHVMILLGGDLPPPNRRDHDAARGAYEDYLRAQLIGYAEPDYGGLLEQLDAAADAAARAGLPMPFATLMGIETRMAAVMSDEHAGRAYWIVRDRLDRVGSRAGIAQHDAWVPPSMREPVAGPATAAPPPDPDPKGGAGADVDDDDDAPPIDGAGLARAAAESEAAARATRSAEIAASEDDPAPDDAPDPAAPAGAVDEEGA